MTNPVYAASKAGLDGLTRSLAAALGPHDINVNAVAREFGGGGHTNASGCSARGEFADLKALFEAKLARAIEEQ